MANPNIVNVSTIYANTAVVSAGATATTIVANGGTGANTASQALTNLGGIGIGKAIAMAIIFGGG